MQRLVRYFPLFVLTMLMSACKGGRFSLFGDDDPAYLIDTVVVQKYLTEAADTMHLRMYADKYTKKHFLNENENEDAGGYVWISGDGVTCQADTLLRYLRTVEGFGFREESFFVDDIQADIDTVRAHYLQDATQDSMNLVMARLEFNLTRAMLRYAYGQRYGYVKPHLLFNTLLRDADRDSSEVHYRWLFDIPCDEPSDSLMTELFDAVREERLHNALEELQPNSDTYRTMLGEYRRARDNGETRQARLARINLERSRWRYPQPEGGQYIWVNLAGYTLTAVDTERDTMMTMRICAGNQTHKSPMLMSSISYVELNPYWTVPMSIIRNEYCTRHIGDTAYFRRNNIHAIVKKTKEEVNPGTLTESDLRSGRYTLRQEKGDGNSLGRMIFRFKNRFSVYLHDTNNHGAFARQNRALSHGCIRLERPYELFRFFMGENPDSLRMDKVRMSIDLEPLSQRGKRWKENNPDAAPMHSVGLAVRPKLWIDYWTLAPSISLQGGSDSSYQTQLVEYPDTYGYDREIERVIDAF